MFRVKENLGFIIASFGLLVLIVILWLPFGLKSGDIQEHWHIRTMIELGQINYDNIRENYLLELALTRPIARLLYWTSYFLTPTSFISDNLLLMLILWLKALALMALILKLFPRRYVLVFIIAAFALVYPADSASASIRIPHLHFATCAYLLASNFLLAAWQNHKKLYVLAMILSLFIVGFSYEALYPITFLTPVILLIKERKLSWRLFRYACAWYIPIILTLSYSLFLIFGMGFGFQSTAASGSLTIKEIVLKLLRLYQRIFYSSWELPTENLNMDFFPYAIGIGALVLLFGGLLLYLNKNHEQAFNRWEFGSFLLGSFGLIALGYLMYIPTNRSGIDSVYRVFLNSSIAGAAFIAFFGYQLALLMPRKIGMFLWLLLLSLGISIGSYIHINYHSNYHQRFINQGIWLEPIFEIVPGLQEPANIFLISESGRIPNESGQRQFVNNPHILTSALQYIYEPPAMLNHAMFCPDMERTCQISAEGLTVFYERERRPSYSILYPGESLILILLRDDNSILLLTEYPNLNNYHPENLIIDSETLPSRFLSIFSD